MKTTTTLVVRAFPVTVLERSTGTEREERIVVTKEQLKAAQLVGQSSRELIARLCERAGLTVLDVGTPKREEIGLNLEELFKFHGIAAAGKRRRSCE